MGSAFQGVQHPSYNQRGKSRRVGAMEVWSRFRTVPLSMTELSLIASGG